VARAAAEAVRFVCFHTKTLQERPGLVAVLVGPRSAKIGLKHKVSMHPVKLDAGYELAFTTSSMFV
jgi:hypothetical protein